jgi:hypothetical protein
MKTYNIVRYFQDHPKEVIEEDVTLEDALEHCLDLETSSKTCTMPEGHERTRQFGPWFDGYEEQ